MNTIKRLYIATAAVAFFCAPSLMVAKQPVKGYWAKKLISDARAARRVLFEVEDAIKNNDLNEQPELVSDIYKIFGTKFGNKVTSGLFNESNLDQLKKSAATHFLVQKERNWSAQAKVDIPLLSVFLAVSVPAFIIWVGVPTTILCATYLDRRIKQRDFFFKKFPAIKNRFDIIFSNEGAHTPNYDSPTKKGSKKAAADYNDTVDDGFADDIFA